MQEQVQKNPFIDRIKEILTTTNNDGTLEKMIVSINNKLKSETKEELTTNEYILLGSMSYFVGLDFCQQQVLDKKIVQKFIERFKVFNFSETIIKTFQEIISNGNIVEGIEKPKDLLKEEIYDNVKATQLELNNIRILVNTIFKNSIFPSIYSNNINDLINTKKYSYHDVITINNIIQQNLNIDGGNLKTIAKLYQDKVFTKMLQNADRIFNDTKFAIVYYDSIVSCVEVQKRFESIKITDFLSEEYFDKFDFENVEQPKKEVEKTSDDEENEKRIARENELNTLQQKYPELFIAGVLKDFLKVDKFNNPIQILEAIETASQNNDYMQHVYHYMKAANKDFKHSLIEVFELSEDQIKELHNLILDKIAELRGETKALTEILLKPIPEEKINSVINYINDTIESLIIFGVDEKGYLMSQLIENQISTYQHLLQILSIIEKLNIKGSKLQTYVTLSDYLQNHTEALTIFESTSKLDGMYNKLAFYQEVRDFYFPTKKDEGENLTNAEVIEDTKAKVDLKVEIKDAQ